MNITLMPIKVKQSISIHDSLLNDSVLTVGVTSTCSVAFKDQRGIVVIKFFDQATFLYNNKHSLTS